MQIRTRWIVTDLKAGEHRAHCPDCGYIRYIPSKMELPNYCEKCGGNMNVTMQKVNLRGTDKESLKNLKGVKEKCQTGEVDGFEKVEKRNRAKI